MGLLAWAMGVLCICGHAHVLLGLFIKFRSRWSFAEEIKELEALTRLRMLTSFQKKLRLNIRLYKSIVTIGHLKDTNCCTFTVLVPCSMLYSSNVQWS